MLLHKPTGIIIKCRKFRTQFLNRQEAWAMLHRVLRDRHEEEKLRFKSQSEKKRRQNRKRSASAKERMLEAKKKHAFKKQNRKQDAWE
jgi:protein subunit release factor B